MIRLTDWYLSPFFEDTDDERYGVHGLVSGHPERGDGFYTWVGDIKNLRLDKPGKRFIMMLIDSDYEYELLLAEMNFQEFEKTQAYLQKLHVPVPDLSECQKLQEKAEYELMAKVDGILQNNELYLRITGVITLHAFFKNDVGEIRKIRVTPHMKRSRDDCYIISDFEKGGVDFRYRDVYYNNGMKPYQWSDGLKAIRIENVGKKAIKFWSSDEPLCEPGKITFIEDSQYKTEVFKCYDLDRVTYEKVFLKDLKKAYESLKKVNDMIQVADCDYWHTLVIITKNDNKLVFLVYCYAGVLEDEEEMTIYSACYEDFGRSSGKIRVNKKDLSIKVEPFDYVPYDPRDYLYIFRDDYLSRVIPVEDTD